jgi:hypothetical protein
MDRNIQIALYRRCRMPRTGIAPGAADLPDPVERARNAEDRPQVDRIFRVTSMRSWAIAVTARDPAISSRRPILSDRTYPRAHWLENAIRL